MKDGLRLGVDLGHERPCIVVFGFLADGSDFPMHLTGNVIRESRRIWWNLYRRPGA